MQNSIDPFKIVPQGLQTSSRLGGQTHVFSISKHSQRAVSEEQIYKVGLVDSSYPRGHTQKPLLYGAGWLAPSPFSKHGPQIQTAGDHSCPLLTCHSAGSLHVVGLGHLDHLTDGLGES